MFKTQHLRYLSGVAAEGSIRAAARALGVSQASVTQGLRELEIQAGIALLRRRGGGVDFTAAGLELLAHAQRLLAQLAQAEQALAVHRNALSTQTLRVGVTPWIAETLLPRMLPGFRAEMPTVRLELMDGLSTQAYPKLREGSLDLILGRIVHGEAMDGLQAQPLFQYELTVVARAGHPRGDARSMADLLMDDWIVNFTPGEAAAYVHNLFGQHGLKAPLERIHISHAASLMLTLVRQSDMLTFCPWPLLETSRLRQELVALPLRERFQANTVGIIRRANEAPSQKVARFMAHFLDHARAWPSCSDPEMRRILRTVDVLESFL